jgi:hypothetical protein
VVAVTKRTRFIVLGIAVALAVVALVIAASRRPRAVRKAPDPHAPIALAVGEVPPEPSIWIDVHAPAEVYGLLRSNDWVSRALSEPLGQGASAGWAGFLATQGGDLGNAFEGAVLDLFVRRLLVDPFRVVFFAGPAATGAPALVVARPSAAALGAYDLLEAAARNGSYAAPRCPGPEPKGGPPAAPITVSRWLIAEQALFGGQRDGRLALARNPAAVVQALCAAPPDVPAAEGIDLSVSFSREALGREAQLAAALLGLGPAPRLAFAVQGDRLEPRGLAGELSEPGRLAAVPPPRALLQLVPADAAVVSVVALRLPEQLGRESLAAHLKGTYPGPYAVRSVALVWNPRGERGLPTEVALAWPERDAGLLREVFSGPNRMERRRVCGHEVYASTGALATSMAKACEGKAPSILNAAPAVAGGLAQEASVELGVNVGLLLSRLLGDAHAPPAAPVAKPAPEIESARRLLEELPFVGLRGVAKGGALVPGGFRS